MRARRVRWREQGARCCRRGVVGGGGRVRARRHGRDRPRRRRAPRSSRAGSRSTTRRRSAPRSPGAHSRDIEAILGYSYGDEVDPPRRLVAACRRREVAAMSVTARRRLRAQARADSARGAARHHGHTAIASSARCWSKRMAALSKPTAARSWRPTPPTCERARAAGTTRRDARSPAARPERASPAIAAAVREIAALPDPRRRGHAPRDAPERPRDRARARCRSA